MTSDLEDLIAEELQEGNPPIEESPVVPDTSIWTDADEVRLNVLQGISSTKRTAVESTEMENLALKKSTVLKVKMKEYTDSFLKSEEYKAFTLFTDQLSMRALEELLEPIPELISPEQANEWIIKCGSRGMRIGNWLVQASFHANNFENMLDQMRDEVKHGSANTSEWTATAESTVLLGTLADVAREAKAWHEALKNANFAIRLQMEAVEVFLGQYKSENSINTKYY